MIKIWTLFISSWMDLKKFNLIPISFCMNAFFIDVWRWKSHPHLMCLCMSVFVHSFFFLRSRLYATHIKVSIISMSQHWTHTLAQLTICMHLRCNIYLKTISSQRWWTSELWNGHSRSGKMITLEDFRFVWISQSHELPIERSWLSISKSFLTALQIYSYLVVFSLSLSRFYS